MATGAIASCAHLVLRTRVVVSKTTLVEAWWWGDLAFAVWTLTWLATDVLDLAREGVADQLWLAASVLIISPFVAVLGARRPGSRVWSFFVVLPVAVVLLLPAVTAWSGGWPPTPLRLELPMLAGYCLVLVMGTGNYIATRFAGAAFLAAIACLLVVLPMSTFRFWNRLPLLVTHAMATLSLCLAIGRAAWQARRIPVSAGGPFDLVWIDFRDFFGIVWARRILERMNEAAIRDGWSLRLDLHGFAATNPAEPRELSPSDAEQIERTLRWLLRRFVDSEWIDARLSRANPE